ncbi:hypothetical protein C2G38_2066985 [Gigaspora rosea]|uniref:BTB domain-containing protein n=1 Tax=Gigaspora rosea TaxID=44941 RepID=A0A397VV09_9GLOM|nr:hypothetical protein C2G38_2066985 [Gigaspora rosea]
MTANHLEKLSIDYLELLNDKEDFNVIINAGESLNTKIFRAHSNVLRYRSLYFRNKLESTSKDVNNIKTINLEHVSIQQFEFIIKYIYGGVVLLENQETSFIFELMFITSEFLLEDLTKHIENHLIEIKANWLRLHFTQIYQKSFQNNKFQNLQEWCNDFLVKYPDKIFNSEDFTSIQLVLLIKRDDLQMKEIEIWKYIIKWGIAQNPGLSSNGPENWTNENFLTLFFFYFFFFLYNEVYPLILY